MQLNEFEIRLVEFINIWSTGRFYCIYKNRAFQVEIISHPVDLFKYIELKVYNQKNRKLYHLKFIEMQLIIYLYDPKFKVLVNNNIQQYHFKLWIRYIDIIENHMIRGKLQKC